MIPLGTCAAAASLRRTFAVVLNLVGFICLGSEPAAPVTHARVFFSGHSLLDNPIPDFVETIATSLGQELGWNQQIMIGSPIRARSWGEGDWSGYRQGRNRNGDNLDVVQELKSPRIPGAGAPYDALIITERHDILNTILWEDSVGFLRQFHDEFIEGNPQGRTYFTQTWLEIDKTAPRAWIEYERTALVAWECVTSKVNLRLEADGRADRVTTSPGGAALAALIERILAGEVAGISGTPEEKLDRVFTDNVHLTPLGAYFLAAFHHGVIFRQPSSGAAGPPGANPETVRDLQRIAWEVVSNYYSQPNPGTRTMEECRATIARDVCPRFWALRGDPTQTRECQVFFQNDSGVTHPLVSVDPFLPGGDPSAMGWLTVFGYLVAAGLSFRTGSKIRLRERGQKRLWQFWMFAALVLLLLGINKQLDLQTWFIQVVRDFALEQGWYAVRRRYQIAFILGLFVAGAGGTLGLALTLRSVLRRCAGGLVGLGFLTAFVAVRASSFHHVDFLLKYGAFPLNSVLELGGILLVAASAWRATPKPASSSAR